MPRSAPSFVRRLAVLAVMIGVSVPAPDGITREAVASGGQKRSYFLYVPADAGAGPAPLVVVLHGAGQHPDALVSAWTGVANRAHVVVAGPETLDPGRWQLPQDGPDFLHDVVEAVKQKQRIDPRRVYLFGHSAGAVFALVTGLLESRYFAAVALSAGAFQSSGEFRLLDFARRKIPFADFVGTEDQYFPLPTVRATRDAFVAAGLPFELTEMKGRDHNYSRFAGQINEQAWSFLATHPLPTNPTYDHHTIR